MQVRTIRPFVENEALHVGELGGALKALWADVVCLCCWVRCPETQASNIALLRSRRARRLPLLAPARHAPATPVGRVEQGFSTWRRKA